jgi:adenosylmethionine-8-amino-7-oxononanoate aminotransferase
MSEQEPSWLKEGAPHLWRPYAQMKTAAAPLPVVRTEGSRLYLSDGSVLIDGIASWWTSAHGYNHPHILAAMHAQLDAMPHVMLGGLAHEQAYRLAARLAALLPGDLNHAFFAESGSVAVEVAMKMAIQFHLNQGSRGRTRFVSFKGGYHGDTLAAMMVCDPDEGMHTMFGGVLPAQHIVDLPRDEDGEASLDRFLAAHGENIAAILVEPLVQGAGGMIFHPPETLRMLRRLADKHGLLLIFDEIFTGFGRTSTLFAMQHAGIEPDIITLSKALTGGVSPLSCAVASTRVFDAFWSDDPMHALMHGPTYMGHALGCAAANASLDLFERTDWAGNVQAIERALRSGLEPCRDYAQVADVRVLGAIGVVELKEQPKIADMIARFAAKGAWIKPFGRVVYLTPSLAMAQDDVAFLTAAIRDVLRD